MMKVLVCDKTEKECIEQMRAAGLTVDTNFEITPEQLMTILPGYDVVVVRSRTKIRQPLIDVCPNLKLIVRGGVGLDTIDVEYARSKGIVVKNTPLASARPRWPNWRLATSSCWPARSTKRPPP